MQTLPPPPGGAAELLLRPPSKRRGSRHPDNSRQQPLQADNPPWHRLFPVPYCGIGSRRWKPPCCWKPPQPAGYLMVLDGIWDINIDWYFKFKEKLKSVSGDGDGHVIISSRLPHKAWMMVGPHNLYHMQPLLTSMEHVAIQRKIGCT